MADLSVGICGIQLRNPLVLASGPLSWNAEAIRAAFDAGAAAVVTKTIRPRATVNPTPHMSRIGRRSLLNTEGWSDLPAGQWIEEELPSLRDRDGVLIASTGHTPAEVGRLARPLARSGVDLLELVSYDVGAAAPMVEAVKRLISVPVLVKISPNWPDVQQVVADCLRAGADGVTAIDSVGPTLSIDVETGRPTLGGFAWLSGDAIRPIALRVVADVCLREDVPVVGTGGVGTATDVIEMLMAGAVAVGVHTAPLLQGLPWFSKTLRRLDDWLDQRGWDRASDVRGEALPHLRREVSGSSPTLDFDAERCTQCGRCVTVCAYRARAMTSGGKISLERGRCRSCGLCASACPTGALSFQ